MDQAEVDEAALLITLNAAIAEESSKATDLADTLAAKTDSAADLIAKTATMTSTLEDWTIKKARSDLATADHGDAVTAAGAGAGGAEALVTAKAGEITA